MTVAVSAVFVFVVDVYRNLCKQPSKISYGHCIPRSPQQISQKTPVSLKTLYLDLACDMVLLVNFRSLTATKVMNMIVEVSQVSLRARK